MGVSITTQPSFSVGNAVSNPRGSVGNAPSDVRGHDISADAKRFIGLVDGSPASPAGTSSAHNCSSSLVRRSQNARAGAMSGNEVR